MSLQQSLAWRYATKKFDHTKKITSDDLNNVLNAVQLAPSSFGLQHYKIVVVEDAAVREQLKHAAYGQPQVTEASQLIVFAAETNINEDYVKRYIDEIAQVRNVGRDSLSGFENVMLGKITQLTYDEKLAWAQKQAYIALGVLISAASEAGIDSSPMEGFNATKFDEILGLTEKGLTATVIAAIGYRAEDDTYSRVPKVRKPATDLFIKI